MCFFFFFLLQSLIASLDPDSFTLIGRGGDRRAVLLRSSGAATTSSSTHTSKFTPIFTLFFAFFCCCFTVFSHLALRLHLFTFVPPPQKKHTLRQMFSSFHESFHSLTFPLAWLLPAYFSLSLSVSTSLYLLIQTNLYSDFTERQRKLNKISDIMTEQTRPL